MVYLVSFVFSAAVTDVLLENHIHFAYVNGVSSGSMTAMNYVSRQNGRMLLTTKTYLHDKRYMGLRHLIKKRMIFNFDSPGTPHAPRCGTRASRTLATWRTTTAVCWPR